jgi:hypothetical protein
LEAQDVRHKSEEIGNFGREIDNIGKESKAERESHFGDNRENYPILKEQDQQCHDHQKQLTKKDTELSRKEGKPKTAKTEGRTQ